MVGKDSGRLWDLEKLGNQLPGRHLDTVAAAAAAVVVVGIVAVVVVVVAAVAAVALDGA